jgi:hypothetical protein
MNRGAQSATLGGTTTLVLNATSTADEIQVTGEILVLDPDGNKALYLPPVAASKGMVLRIINSANAAEVITITELAAGALGTAASVALARQEQAYCVCDGTDWYVNILNATT